MHTLLYFAIFQGAWFATVMGAANGLPWIGLIAVPAAAILQRPSPIVLAIAAVLGLAVDSVLIAARVFEPVPFLTPQPVSPAWMVMLWINQASALHSSLAWLQGRIAAQVLFGGIGGPAAYYAGARLGAAAALPDTQGLLILCATWAIVFPLLMSAAKSFPAASATSK